MPNLYFTESKESILVPRARYASFLAVKKKKKKKKQSVKSNQISQFWGFGSLNVVRTGSIPRLEGAAG